MNVTAGGIGMAEFTWMTEEHSGAAFRPDIHKQCSEPRSVQLSGNGYCKIGGSLVCDN